MIRFTGLSDDAPHRTSGREFAIRIIRHTTEGVSADLWSNAEGVEQSCCFGHHRR